MEEKKFVRWRVTEDDLKDMTPLKARNIIAQCFFEAQKETFARTKQMLGAKVTDEEIQKSVVNVMKAVCKDINCSYEAPTPGSLMQMVQSLATMAKGWGTPEDIIGHHKVQIEKVLGKLF